MSVSASESFRRALRRLLDERGWGHRRLAAELQKHGALGRSALERIERGERAPRLDEVFEIAFVLGTSPLYMIVPQTPGSFVRVTESIDAPAVVVEQWIQGMTALPGQSDALFDSTQNALRLAALAEMSTPSKDDKPQPDSSELHGAHLAFFEKKYLEPLTKAFREAIEKAFEDFASEQSKGDERGGNQ